jgi:glutaconate CoA-transferase subunit B
VLDGWFPFSSAEEIKANTGWALRIAPHAREIAEPSATELANLRKVDQTGALRKK